LPFLGPAATTHEQYRRTARKLAERAGRDPAELDEAAVRAHLLYCKTELNYAPSSMRAACAALRFLYHTVLGRDWKLFDLVRCADHHRLPPERARALTAIERCRTPALGGQVYRCAKCDTIHVGFHSCDHRSCPRCRGSETAESATRQEIGQAAANPPVVAQSLSSELSHRFVN